MARTRLPIGVLVTALAISGFGTASSSSGQSPETRGVTYGGVRNVEPVWLRLDSSRNVILALEIPWEASGRRCSDKKGYSSALYTGAEYSQTIVVDDEGKFARTVVDRYRDAGTRYVETQTVKGKFNGARVSGTIGGTVKRTKPNGQVVRCTFGPLNWTAVD
jgi:outer membrane lipoprotein SlyB